MVPPLRYWFDGPVNEGKLSRRAAEIAKDKSVPHEPRRAGEYPGREESAEPRQV